MAAKPTSKQIALQELAHHITCAVCLEEFVDPKTLVCQHVFCLACLERLPQEDGHDGGGMHGIDCPTCRNRTVLPAEGARALPTAFLLNHLKDTHSQLKQLHASDLQPTLCSDHNKPLDLFCETCDTLTCNDCSALVHIGHNYELVTECYPKCYKKLTEYLKPIKGKIEAHDKVLLAINEGETEIKEKEEAMLDEIHKRVEDMINILRQSETAMVERVKNVIGGKLQELSEHKRSTETNLKVLKDVEEQVEINLQAGIPQQVLGSMKQMMERISQVVPQIMEEEQLHSDSLVLVKDGKKGKSMHEIASIVETLRHCNVEISEDAICVDDHGQVSFLLSMKILSDSALICVPLSSLECSLVPAGEYNCAACTISTTGNPGEYKVHCKLLTNGTYVVKVQAYKVPLNDAALVIPINPHFNIATPIRTINDLDSPWGLAIMNDGDIIVSEHYSNSVTVLDTTGTRLNSFGRNNIYFTFTTPRGIAIACNIILVSTDHMIWKVPVWKISMLHDVRAAIIPFGNHNNELLQFNKPDGIAISSLAGLVYIADRNNHHIKVLNLQMQYLKSFGCKGSADGQFKHPTDVAVDNDGFVYVTDRDNHRIQKFDRNGGFVHRFGGPGSGPGQLQKPVGIAINNTSGFVYVSEDANHRISVFNSDGCFFKSFGSYGNRINQFKYPKNLAFDENEFLYICDYGNDRIVVY